VISKLVISRRMYCTLCIFVLVYVQIFMHDMKHVWLVQMNRVKCCEAEQIILLRK